MNRLIAVAAAIILLTLSAPASAQSWELSGFAAYTPSVAFDRRAPELSQFDVRGGLTWGVQGAFTPHWGAEALWTQRSAQQIGTDAGTTPLHDDHPATHATVHDFGGAASRQRLFVFGGLGATFFSADDFESETKLSFGFGGGVKYFPWKAIGLRGHVRYKATMLNDEDAGDVCLPFGFCQGSLQQFEFAAGAVVRF
jgi:hypothetical protein